MRIQSSNTVRKYLAETIKRNIEYSKYLIMPPMIGRQNHQTDLFRDQIITNLPSYLIEKYPNGVPIYCYACSDGSEPYSIAIGLSEKLGIEKAKRTFPIHASDIDPDLIAECVDGNIILESKWEQDFRKYTSFEFVNAFKDGVDLPIEGVVDSSYKQYKVADALRQMIKFEYKDITIDAEKYFQEPVVLLFRNAWYHLNAEKAEKLARGLYKNLQPGSIIINGKSEFERKCRSEISEDRDDFAIWFLKDAGFKPNIEALKALYPGLYSELDKVFPQEQDRIYVSYVFER